MPLGEVDISFYRDDVGARRPAASPSCTRRASTSRSRARGSCLWTTCSTRAHGPGRDRGAVRLRPPRPRAARRARGPRASRAADSAGLRRQEPADLALRAGERATGGEDGVDEVEIAGVGTPDGGGGDEASAVDRRSVARRHRADDDRRGELRRGRGRDIKKVPTLRGRTIVNLFYESSTRTSSSFELAAKRLSADLVSVRSTGSSVDKGESLRDTVATLSAYDPAAIVIRSPWAGAAAIVARDARPRW